jgi:8-oxo-dGTP pyrophosphatase MutT (NUDIX family)
MLRFAYRLAYQGLRLYWRLFSPTLLGAQVLCVRDGSVLLVRLTYSPGWYFPGGGVNRGESFREAAMRELREECGLEARSLKLLGLYHGFSLGKTDIISVFVCDDFAPIANKKPDAEIADLQFFPFEQIPKDVIPPVRRRIEEHLGLRPISNSF